MRISTAWKRTKFVEKKTVKNEEYIIWNEEKTRGITNRFSKAEDEISDLGDKVAENIQPKEQKEKKIFKMYG